MATMAEGSVATKVIRRYSETIAIAKEVDVVIARAAGRDLARDLGFGLADQTRLPTAISELTRNVIRYAGTGQCVLADESDRNLLRIVVTVEDHGPGIPDIEQAMTDGFSTGKSLGAGLPGARRLVQEFDIESRPGHTVVSISLVKARV